MLKISLGCGWLYQGSTFEHKDWNYDQKVKEKKRIKEHQEYIGIDSGNYGQHFVRDIRRGLPFSDSSVDFILADSVLEHIMPTESFGEDDYIFVINDCLRVLKLCCQMKIIVPWGAEHTAVKDPTHYRFFDEQSFKYLSPDNAWEYGFKKSWRVIRAAKLAETSDIMEVILEKIDDREATVGQIDTIKITTN